MESDKMMGEIEKAKALGLPLWADALSDAVFIHDWQGRIFFSNQVGCSWLGVDQAAVGSVNLFAEVSLDVCRLRERLNQSGELSFELQLSDGRFLDIRAYANLFPFDGEEIVVSIARDVTAPKALERINSESEEWFRTLFHIAPNPYFLYDLGGTILDSNTMTANMVGCKKGELVGRDFFALKLIPMSQFPKALALLATNAMGKGTGPDEFDLHRPDGTVIPIEVTTSVITRDNKKIVVAVANDISAKRAAAETERDYSRKLAALVSQKTTELQQRNTDLLLEIAEREKAEKTITAYQKTITAMLDSIIAGVILVDPQTHIIRKCNKKAEQLFGRSEQELVGKQCHRFICPAMAGKCPVTDLGHTIDSSERILLNQLGAAVPILKTVVPIVIEGENYLIESFIDLSNIKQAEQALLHSSFHDSLTGTYNRTYFQKRVQELQQHPVAGMGVIIIDADGLKTINDSFGHDKGDYLLSTIAGILQRSVSTTDIVARTGGDEFAVLALGGGEEKILRIIGTIQQLIAKHNQDSNLEISLSIGYATGNDGRGDNLETMIKKADDDMCRQKLLHRHSARNAIVSTLRKTLAERDSQTDSHSGRVIDMVTAVAQALSLNENSLAGLKLLAEFHDIGKIGIPDEILRKPGKLTAEELSTMRRHPEIGHRIANSAMVLHEISDWILLHHEWWNGQGYPLGLQGDKIPLECRILAIADAYDAMMSDRPYRQAMSQTAAIAELRRFAGVQFDPELVDLFLRVAIDRDC